MNNYLTRVTSYTNAMLQAKKMYESHLINDDELIRIEDKMAEKYCINSKSLYRQNRLIQSAIRGNITPDEEV